MIKEDCYWYDEWQDMSAHIPICRAGKNLDEYGLSLQDCDGCEQYHSKYKATNADKIRNMNDEEMAKYLAQLADKQTCSIDWLAFLKKEESDV